MPILGLPPKISVVHEGLGLRNAIFNLSVFLVRKHTLSQLFLSPIRLIMPELCVMCGCSNTASSTRNISVYRIPYWDDNSPIAISRRKKWLSFIRLKRDKWLPSIGPVVCSVNFTEDSFEINTLKRGCFAW